MLLGPSPLCPKSLWSPCASSLVLILVQAYAEGAAPLANLKFVYVGNLPWKATGSPSLAIIFISFSAHSHPEDDVRAAFKPHGAVERVRIVRDEATGRSRGFAFVGFSSGFDAAIAVRLLIPSFPWSSSTGVKLPRERPMLSHVLLFSLFLPPLILAGQR